MVARASRLRGARNVTDMVTVTGTENLMMAATLADGQTIIENAATGSPVAWFPGLYSAVHPKESVWSAGEGDYLSIIRLESG